MDEETEWLSELIHIKPRLLKWVDSDNPDIAMWINPNMVSGVTVLGNYMYLAINGESISTQDNDTIFRFWEEWELIQ